MKVLLVHAPRRLGDELIGRGLNLVVAHFPGEWSEQGHVGDRTRFVPFPHRQKIDPRAIRDMRRLIHAHRPDLIHAFSPRSLAAAVLATMGMRSRPRIVSFRGISTPPRWFDPSDRITYLSPRVDAHTCESEAVADGLVRAGVSRESCHVVYNCVDRQSLDPHDRDGVLGRFGIPPDAFLVGTIASIRPVKRVDTLLHAALRCLDLPDLHVLLVGGIKDVRVSRLARDSRWGGRLQLAGFIPDGGGLAAALDLFVMPSRSEGLCRALLEAMSLGTCPIVSDAGGMKEVVRDGREGVVFPSGDVAALAEAIRHLHGQRSLIGRYGQAARERVAAMCSPAAVADRVELSYRSVMRDASAARPEKARLVA